MERTRNRRRWTPLQKLVGLRREVGLWIDRHKRLERRLHWLLDWSQALDR